MILRQVFAENIHELELYACETHLGKLHPKRITALKLIARIVHIKGIPIELVKMIIEYDASFIHRKLFGEAKSMVPHEVS